MTKLVSLDIDTTVSLDVSFDTFLAPDFIYLPLPKKKTEIKRETKIKKGSLVYPGMYAPVSGKLVKLEKCILATGVEVPCLVLSNDFQEKITSFPAARKKINHLSKEDFLESIYDAFLKEKFVHEGVFTLVISGIDDEPYMNGISFLQRNSTKVILEMVDSILQVYPRSKAIIAIKSSDTNSIEAYNNFLGMFSNIEIRLVENVYLIGTERFLIQKLHIKDAFIYLTVYDLYRLYEQVKKRRPVLESFLTITGDAITSPKFLRVKYGTKVKDILEKFYTIDFSTCDVYFNGIMQGKILDIKRVIVTPLLRGIVIQKKKNINIYPCVKCGKCISVCPIKTNPLIAYKMQKKIKCIECGLCSYICPSHIPLYKYVGGDADE